MRQVVEYTDPLGPGVWLAARLVTDGGVLISYALVLLAEAQGAAQTVRVFDNAHGGHEMHRYTRDGVKQSAELFHHGTASEAMNAARLWILEGWEAMVDSWRS